MLKQSRQSCFTKPTPSTWWLACLKEKIPVSANVIHSISASLFIPKSHIHLFILKSHIYMVIVLAKLNAGYDDFSPNELFSFKKAMGFSY